MSFLILFGGMVILSSVIYCSGNVTYHIAFLGRNQTSSDVALGRLMIQGQEPALGSPVTDALRCEWENISSSSIITYFQPSNDCTGLIPSGTGLNASGFKVTLAADNILNVFQTDESGNDADGFLAIADEHIGNEYFVITYCALGGFCQFAVAGTVDGTTVNIVFPPSSSTNHVTCNGGQLSDSAPPGQPVSFTLNEFSVLHFESQLDLSGTYISSDHKVSVFVGARNMPNDNGIDSFLIEQIPPVNKWGTEFVVAPNELNKAGDVIKILTKEDDTLIHIQGFTRLRIKNKGESTVHRVDWKMPSRIMTSKPVLIVQVMSVNLYNDTTAITGQPAMVLVPHVQQWNDKDVTINCFQKTNSVVTTTASYTNIAWITGSGSPDIATLSTWESVEGTHYKILPVVSTQNIFEEIKQIGDKRISYGYCGGIAAFLLDSNWEWENQECKVTVPVPGDGVDNDCNGFADEVDCTEDDIAIHFTSTQDSNTGAVKFKRINIKGRRALTFTVTSCDVAVVVIQSSAQPKNYFTIYIWSKSVILKTSMPGSSDLVQQNITAECQSNRTFEIKWYTTATSNTTHELKTANGTIAFEVQGQTLDYDVMVLTSFVGTTHFIVDLPEKDCGKIISKVADSWGKSFLVYLSETDVNVWVLITNVGTSNVNIGYNGDDYETDIKPDMTLTVRTATLDSKIVDHKVLIKASAEVSVFVWREPNDFSGFGSPVLPTDVLGPNVHLYLDSTVSAPNDEICTVFPMEGEATSKIGVALETNSKLVITKQKYNELDSHGLFTADCPIAVFCGADDSMVQMPPRESLGMQHYIPEINLSKVKEHATIRLVATEDSTVVIIRGNYDQLDTVNLTGTIYTRPYESNMLYNISATKPIQVILEFQTSVQLQTGLTSLVVIPAVEQYMNEHVFPGFPSDFAASLLFSTAVASNGTSVDSKVSDRAGTSSDVNAAQKLGYESPTFTLTFMEIGHYPLKKMFVVPSNVKYENINQVCTKTRGQPGDEEDNDCDGLIDEERCSDELYPGHIDVDIDGNLNEDCAANTSVSSSAISLALVSERRTCVKSDGAVEGNSTDNDEPVPEPVNGDKIIIANGTTPGYTCCPDPPNVETVTGSEATYKHSQNRGGLIIIYGTTTSELNSTAEETCLTDCVCPCSWINPPKNYTPKELQAKVAEIQEKLRISKKYLSSVIRKKTSAHDHRPEATAVGYVGVTFLVCLIGAIVLLDLNTIIRDVRNMIRNLQEVFQP